MNDDKLNAAVSYAARGWKVFPLAPDTKDKPLVSWGSEATSDTNKVSAWWRKTPDANIGIVTGAGECGPYVVDIDAPQGGHKNDGAASLSAAGISLPATLTATTPNGGRHYYYGIVKPPSKEKLHSCANANELAGVDIRAGGGYIVAPPSSIGGRCYKWENYETTRYLADYPSALYLKPKPTTAPVPAPAPSSIRDERRAPTIERARQYLTACDAAISGQGGHNATLHAAHALAVGFALDDDTSLGLLLSEYNPRCVPPWTEKELRHKIESAKANPQKPVGYLLNADNPLAALKDKMKRSKKIAATTAQVTPTEDDFAERYSRRRLLCDFHDPLPEDENPDALFRNGWLRRGGGCVIIAPSGVGKSVISTQICDHFALGRSVFGIEPVRPLKIAVYQAEDDATEVADFRNNIRSGLLPAGWTREDIAQAEKNIVYHEVTGLTGENFLRFVQYAQLLDRADLIIINPFQSFAGCDISNNAELSNFLRVLLNPILMNPAAPCGCFIIHHTKKPPQARDRKSWLDTSSAAYAGAGGAELTNWARAVIAIRPHEAVGYYDLVAAKRGKRLNWRDAEGNPIMERPIAHSEGVMYWREPSPEEVAAADAGRKRSNNTKRAKVVEIVEANGAPFSSQNALVEALIAAKVAERTNALKLIKECVANGELVKRPRGNAVEIGTPRQIYGDARYIPDCLYDPAADSHADETAAEAFDDYEPEADDGEVFS